MVPAGAPCPISGRRVISAAAKNIPALHSRVNDFIFMHNPTRETYRQLSGDGMNVPEFVGQASLEAQKPWRDVAQASRLRVPAASRCREAWDGSMKFFRHRDGA